MGGFPVNAGNSGGGMGEGTTRPAVGAAQLPSAHGAISATVGRTSTIAAPVLRDVVSVMDFGATGNGIVDDSTPLQNAVNAVSTAGGGHVLLPAGFSFVLGGLAPASNVTIWAYGAKITRNSAAHGLFFFNSGTLASFTIRGGTYTGTGAETTAQVVLQINTPASSSDVNVYDTTITNWATGPLYFGNCIRARACNNTMVNVCTPAGTNAINFVDQLAGGTTVECIATGNTITGTSCPGVAYVNTGTTSTGDRKVLIANNIVDNVPSVLASCIDVECAIASIGDNSKFVVANNICTHNSTTSTTYTITVLGTAGTDPLLVSRIVVQGNVMESPNARGLQITASYATVTGNSISSTYYTIFAGMSQSFSVTGTTAGSSNQVTAVTGSASIVNGSPITGTGIPGGAFIYSGAGTATYTLSINATGANAGLTVLSQVMFVTITGNTLRCYISPTSPPVRIQQLRDFVFSDNILICDAGSTGAQIGVSLQNVGWFTISGNRINHAPGVGLTVNGGNDFQITNNTILDPAEGGAALGMQIANVTGTTNRVLMNMIVDDRPVPVMTTAIDVSSNTNGTCEVRFNQLLGWTSHAINGGTLVSSDNRYSNGAMTGRAILAAGTKTISTAEVIAADNIILSTVLAGGTQGDLSVGTIVGSTSFVINSSNAADTSTVYWKIDH